MASGLAGKVALVTGGSQGIGAAICRELASQGCDVALTFMGQAADAAPVVAAVESEGRRALPLVADAASSEATEAAVTAVVEALGGLDILVCNAGVTRDGVIWKLSDEQWDEVIAVNLRGYFTFIRAAARIFKSQGGGKIVTVASINGLRGKFGQANYTAAKGGVIALTKTEARELGRYDVNVNCVAPGMVATEMAEQLAPEYREAAIGETVLGRLATPADVAHVVSFLCSDLARHVTGEVVKVDGGQSM